MSTRAFALASVLGVSACMGTEVVTTVPFNSQEVAYVNRSGSNTINGQAFLRQVGGGVVTCAGEEVELVPAGEYARQRITQIYGSEQGGYRSVYQLASDNGDPDYQRMVRRTRCDAEGNFVFSGVANGDYYVFACVSWQAQRYVVEGGCMTQLVNARGGSQRVLLSS